MAVTLPDIERDLPTAGPALQFKKIKEGLYRAMLFPMLVRNGHNLSVQPVGGLYDMQAR